VTVVPAPNEMDMRKSLTISDRDHNGVTVITLDGYADLSTVAKLEAHLDKLITEDQFRVAINCAQLRYISSVGIGVLVGSIDELRDHGGGIALFAVSEEVRETLGLVSFESLIPVLDDLDAACTALAASTGSERRDP